MLFTMAKSVGSITMESGTDRYSAQSSNGIWVPPLYAAHTPGSEPRTFTPSFAYAADMNAWSNARREEKQPKECIQTFLPVAVRPAATPIAFASAIPALMVWFGNSLASFAVLMQLYRSQSTCITLGSAAISSSIAVT